MPASKITEPISGSNQPLDELGGEEDGFVVRGVVSCSQLAVILLQEVKQVSTLSQVLPSALQRCTSSPKQRFL